MRLAILIFAFAALVSACERDATRQGSSGSEGKAAQSAAGGSANEGKAAGAAGR
jgi:hypothetical protein